MTTSFVMSQVGSDLIAIFGFIPLTISSGYIAAWYLDLSGFRKRSLVDRLFWSVGLSFAISPILIFLLSRFVTLNCAVAFTYACAAIHFVLIGREWIGARRTGTSIRFGFRPMGGRAFLLALAWVVISILSLADLKSGNKLFTNWIWVDLGTRLNWTESVLHTGVPPANSLYMYFQPAPMRNYYFWYIICAVISRAFSLPVRAVISAGCTWSGFGLAAILGLYLKYFLQVGQRLRRQFIVAICLLAVTGLDICVWAWKVFVLHQSLPFDLEWWSNDPIFSWNSSLFFGPNHIVSLVACVFAFLLATQGPSHNGRATLTRATLVGMALASGVGTSVFVVFAFFLVLAQWAIWEALRKRSHSAILFMLLGAGVSLLLLAPFLSEILHGKSTVEGGSIFNLWVRELVPPEWLTSPNGLEMRPSAHQSASRAIAALVLLPFGYAIELGFYLFVLLTFLTRCRGRGSLPHAQRTLLLLALATLPLNSFLRSSVLQVDDFGERVPLIMHFALLLLGSELILKLWEAKLVDSNSDSSESSGKGTIMRFVTQTLIAFGFVSTASQVFFYRFDVMFVGMRSPTFASLYTHNPQLLENDYAKLSALIPPTAVVQANPDHLNVFQETANMMNIGHQTAIFADRYGCGSELGGDSSGCEILSRAIDPLFRQGSARQAHSVCERFGIQYLVTTIYDPVWNDPSSWVWHLPSVLSDQEFRALDCR